MEPANNIFLVIILIRGTIHAALVALPVHKELNAPTVRAYQAAAKRVVAAVFVLNSELHFVGGVTTLCDMSDQPNVSVNLDESVQCFG